ncbi:flagellar export protein FliJ [Citrobacter sp. wls619]|uniref:flagellar export protein FliJ n=1 Tax=Citrobacter sp. wls619 TaxID=2576432 RepID=UPI002017C2A6|nr:flagellar export protein FliJ [Citrobacter sp. wls619]
MNVNNPMAVLRDMAEEKLTETTCALGAVQQKLQEAVDQREQLYLYEQEYHSSLRQGMAGGMSVADLVNHQMFILSLNQVVKQHESHVSSCEKVVDKTKDKWIQKKQRLNAFETLINRREMAQALVESRQEQKLMDEFAQRAGQQREML